ncbi:MAG: pyridoxal phosphate-dependent aminotransferase [Bacteroides sp.]|jgi:aspartate aminotransferase|nr:pyridoxal phosphate-dependent aminotransferase [Bacteroides sp.]
MPKISEKGRMMPASPIRKLVPYADQAKKQGVKVFHLNIGQPDIPTPQSMIDAMHKLDIKVIEYSHSAGILSYRESMCKYYEKHGIQVKPDEIIVTAGASEAILFAVQTCLNPGDEIIIPEPFYANYNGFATSAGVKVKPIISDIDNGFALPPIAEFEKAITPSTKAIMVCNPNNPTGYLYSKEELEILREIVLKYDLFLFADEVYREFCYDGTTHFSVLNLEGLDDYVVLFDSVSKRYSACGVRIGAMISRNKEVMQTAMKFAQARLSPPSLGQIASEAAMATPDSYFDEVIEEYKARRDTVVKGMNKIPGVTCPNPRGAFYVTARLPIDNSDKFCQWLLESFEYEKQTVMLAPATGFYSTPGAGTNEVRISYVLNVGDLEKSIQVLGEALKVYPGRII